MIIDKESDAQDTSDLLEFTAPYALDVCRERLEDKHQNYNLFYPNWSRRNAVRIWEENDNTYRFRLRRTGRHNIFDIVSLAEVHGYLQALAPSETLVVAERRTYALPLRLIGLCLSILSIAVMFQDGLPLRNIISVAATILVLNVVGNVILWVFVTGEAIELEKLVRKALADDTYGKRKF